MNDDEELKNQCFGGDYSGEVFDHMIKRMSFRRQKRWWNAYILFYTQIDVLENPGAKFLSSKLHIAKYQIEN
jgi:ubiquitin carboxyl-terminal hydrolase 9/24